MSPAPKTPVTIEDDAFHDVAAAAPPPDEDAAPVSPAPTVPRRRLRWALPLVGMGLSLWAVLLADRFARYWLERAPVVGTVVTAFLILFAVMALLAILREIGALRRLARTQAIKAQLAQATSAKEARMILAPALRPLRRDPQRAAQIAAFDAATQEALDPDDVTRPFETTILRHQDRAARAIIEQATRQVATVTALVPIALTDMLAVTWINLRMIRRLNEAYGGGSALLSDFKILRGIFAHLMAAGLMDISDDLVGTVIGHGALSKLSRRFGEGAVNGALTARIGLRAQAICRPLEFDAEEQPSMQRILGAALAGLFGQTRK